MARRISRSFRYRVRRPLVVVGLMVLVTLLRLLTSGSPHPSDPESLPEGLYRVQRVVDGDTFLLERGAPVRLAEDEAKAAGRAIWSSPSP
jgi:endonuclease YncB( thermonuclease family)